MSGSTTEGSPAITAGSLWFHVAWIDFGHSGHDGAVSSGLVAGLPGPIANLAIASEELDSSEVRLKWAVAQHSRFVWRTLVRFGVRTADADDAAQEVFMVLARRLADVSVSSEKGFLFRTAVGVASTRRRSEKRRAELLDDRLDGVPVTEPGPEQLVARLRLRRLLQRALDELGDDQRAIFVLIELEGLTTPEVSRLLELPLGTVASRLGRGRRAFLDAIERLELERDLGDYQHD